LSTTSLTCRDAVDKFVVSTGSSQQFREQCTNVVGLIGALKARDMTSMASRIKRLAS
jgi:hypothetical protein